MLDKAKEFIKILEVKYIEVVKFWQFDGWLLNWVVLKLLFYLCLWQWNVFFKEVWYNKNLSMKFL